VVPVFKLTKIFRQAQESSIIRFAHDINKGVTPRVESPFHRPDVWKEGLDCLFIDADEATQEQLKFIKRVKTSPELAIHTTGADHATVADMEEDALYVDEAPDTPATAFVIPDKFRHVDIEQLLQTEGQSRSSKAC